MWICPVCSAQNTSKNQCSSCSFDNSTNLISYPTLFRPGKSYLLSFQDTISQPGYLKCPDCGGIDFRFTEDYQVVCRRCNTTPNTMPEIISNAYSRIKPINKKRMGISVEAGAELRQTADIIAGAKQKPSGTLSKVKMRNWIHPDDAVVIEFSNTLKKAPKDAVDLSVGKNKTVFGWQTGKGHYTIAGEGGVLAPKNCEEMFAELRKLQRIDGAERLATCNVKDMSGMFLGCISLSSLDVSRWDTSQVTDMSWMFGGCSTLSSLDVSRWDTSKVTDMNFMFYRCSALRELDAKMWDTGMVTSHNAMFQGVPTASQPKVWTPKFRD